MISNQQNADINAKTCLLKGVHGWVVFGAQKSDSCYSIFILLSRVTFLASQILSDSLSMSMTVQKEIWNFDVSGRKFGTDIIAPDLQTSGNPCRETWLGVRWNIALGRKTNAFWKQVARWKVVRWSLRAQSQENDSRNRDGIHERRCVRNKNASGILECADLSRSFFRSRNAAIKSTGVGSAKADQEQKEKKATWEKPFATSKTSRRRDSPSLILHQIPFCELVQNVETAFGRRLGK